jgi:hypothetical protein
MMSAALLKQQTDRVRDASDIIKIVGGYVRLRKVGSTGRFIGLCPFHQEKTPSFNVNQPRQFYKCFGCGAGGDVFKFVMKIEGLSFIRAKELLAVRAGVTLGAPCWTPAEGRRYAQATAGADALALRLADFANGLCIVTERQLTALTDALLMVKVHPVQVLRTLHRQMYLLKVAAPGDIARTWRAMRSENPAAVVSMERIGREHREGAESLARAVVDLLVQSQEIVAA